MKRVEKLMFVAAALMGLTAMAETQIQWNVVSGEWSDASNWTPQQLPDSVDGAAAYVDNGGVVKLTAGTSSAGCVRVGCDGTGTLMIDGGTLVTYGYSHCGGNEGHVGEIWVENGAWIVRQSALYVSEYGQGTLTVTNNGVVRYESSDPLYLCNANREVGEALCRLCRGGLIETSQVRLTFAGRSRFVFDGGTLREQKSSSSGIDLMFGAGTAFLAAGGARIDTQSGVCRIAVPLVDDVGCEKAGPLVKLGSGTLVLSEANGYTGGTVISNGTLLAESPETLPGYDRADGLRVCTGAKLALGGGWRAEEIAVLKANAAFEDGVPETLETIFYVPEDKILDEGFVVPGSAKKLGVGTLTLSGRNEFPDDFVVAAGVVRATFGIGLGSARLVLAGGLVGDPSGHLVAPLGTGAGEVSFAAGQPGGFIAKGGPLVVDLGGKGDPLVYGSEAFSPSYLTLNGEGADADVTLSNRLDVVGRTLSVLISTNRAFLAGGICDSAPTGASAFNKDGRGSLVFDPGLDLSLRYFGNALGLSLFRQDRVRFADFRIARGDVVFEDSSTVVGPGGSDTMIGCVERTDAAAARLVVSGGSFACSNDFQVGTQPTSGWDALEIVDGGTVEVAGWPSVARRGQGSQGVVNVRDGRYVQTNPARYANVGEEGHGVLNVYGGGEFEAYGLMVGTTAGAVGEVNVYEGGVLNVGYVTGRNGVGVLTVDGGTLKAKDTSDQALVSGLDEVRVGEKGLTVDTNGRAVGLPQKFSVGRSVAKNLVHRWSFNGDLSDSAGGKTATAVGSGSFANGLYVLPGGVGGTGYVNLGSDIFPSEGEGMTIEIWARQDAVRAWSRIFDFGSSSADAMLWAWSNATNLNKDEIYFQAGGGNLASGKLAPFDLGVEYHLALTFVRRTDGRWNVTAYKQSASTGETLKSVTFTTKDGWSPFAQKTANSYLGHSSSANDLDASASYDEVRIWSVALTEEELTASAKRGPDKAIVGVALRKTGEGSLALTAAGGDVYGDLTVEAGALALGPSALTHRWSFNGDFGDAMTGAQAAHGGRVVCRDGRCSLPGGIGAGYVDLGPGILPTDGDGVTIELWARQDAVKSWSRIFDFSSQTADALLWAWTQADNLGKDAIFVQKGGGQKENGQLAPFEIGVEYHIALTFVKSEGGVWTATAYKQDATTGETLASFVFTTSAGWSPLSQPNERSYLGRSSSPNDNDACASYNEVRIWNRAFTEAELTASALRGPDNPPAYAMGTSGASFLPEARLTVAAGAELALPQDAVTAQRLDVAGTISGGTLAVKDGIYPGGDGVIGELAVSGGACLSGRLVVDADAGGVCDRIVCRSGTLELSGLTLELADDARVDDSSRYVLVEFPPNAVSGVETFVRNAKLPRGCLLKVNRQAGRITLSPDGLKIILR